MSDCSFLCPGNAYEYCGAGNRLELYELTSLVSSSSVVQTTSSTTSSSSILPTTTTSKTSSSSVVTSSSTTKPVTSTTSSSVAPSQTLGIKQTVAAYTFQGCYTEANGIRALSSASFYDYTAMTLEACAADCAGYTYFGVEYGGEV